MFASLASVADSSAQAIREWCVGEPRSGGKRNSCQFSLTRVLLFAAWCGLSHYARADTIIQDVNGSFVAWEAEGALAIVNNAPTFWVVTDDATASGGQALYQAGVNGTAAPSSLASFAIGFRTAGEYSLYIRWRADPVFTGLDPFSANSYFRPNNFGDLGPEVSNYGVSSANNSHLPPAANSYVLTLEARTYTVTQEQVDLFQPLILKFGTREAGMFIDRVVLSLNPLTEAEFNLLPNSDTGNFDSGLPSFTSPVANIAVTIPRGATEILSVAASDATAYRWQRNGVDIPGATSADYVIADASPVHSGQYRCYASNPYGEVRSPLINVMVTATGIFTIEAEDFDYDGGQHIAETSVMPYLGGAYDGFPATYNVDYKSDFPDNLGSAYRTGEPDTPPTVVFLNPAFPNGDFTFTRMDEWTMNANRYWYQIQGGEWGNYTRAFPLPARDYYVLAAHALHRNEMDSLSSNLGLVSSGLGTSDQTVLPLGIFRSPGSEHIGDNNLITLTDDAGAIKTVHLGGLHTIRWSYNSGNADYLVFVPANIPDLPGTVAIEIHGDSLIITENPPNGSTVEAAPAITGPWEPIGPAPQTVPLEGPAQYFRLSR